MDRKAPTGLAYQCKICASLKSKLWRKLNRIRDRKNSSRWRKENPALNAANVSKRRAKKRNATPAWADISSINAIYEVAGAWNVAGFDVQVDHCVPLTSALVCGLHVPANLTIMPRLDNVAKGNRTWVDMP